MLAQNRSTTTPISPEYSIDASQPPHNKLLAQPATSLSLSLGLHLESNVRLSFSSRSSHFRCGISPNAASLFDPQQSNRIAAPSWDTIVSCSSGEGASVEEKRVQCSRTTLHLLALVVDIAAAHIQRNSTQPEKDMSQVIIQRKVLTLRWSHSNLFKALAMQW